MNRAIHDLRSALLASEYLQNNEGSNTFIRTVLPDPKITTNLKVEAHFPQIELREDTETFLQGEAPAGMGQALARYTLQAYIFVIDYRDAEAAKEFCRKAVTNTTSALTCYSVGNPPGRWLRAEIGTVEYLIARVTQEYWGLVARVPVTLEYIVDIDEIRGCA